MKKFLSTLLLTTTLSILSAGEFRLLSYIDCYGRIENGEDYDNLRNRYYAQPEFQASLFNYAVDFTASANVWYEPIGEEGFVDPSNILREAFFSFPLGDFDLSLGQKYETFGFADVFSPLNVINGSNPVLFSLDDPYDAKRADLMLQIQYYPNFDDTLELIYIPFPRPNYEPRGCIEMSDSSVALDFEDQPFLTANPHSLFLRYYHFSPSYDLQLVYGWYTDQAPGFDLSDLEETTTDLIGTADLDYSRNNLFGAGISATVGNTVISEDLAFTMTDDPDGKDPGVKNSFITADTQFTRTILNGTFAQVNIIYQYILNYDETDEVYDSALYDTLKDEFSDYFIQPREHIAFAIVHLHKSFLREKLYLGMNAGYLHPNIYFAPRVSYALSDRLKLETGADINTGEPSDNSLVRSYDYDNFYIRMKYEY